MMTTETISSATNGNPKAGGGFMGHCPAHNDRTPSLSIDEGDNGKPLVNCLAGCSQNAVIDALRNMDVWDDTTPTLSPDELQTMKEKAERRKAERLKADGIKHAKTEKKAKTILENAKEDPVQHAYAISKGLPLGDQIRRGSWVKYYKNEASGEWMKEVWPDCLLFPIYSSDKKLVSVQAIRVLTPEQRANDEKDKDFLAGGRIKSCFHPVGKISGVSGLLVIGEGWATVAAVCEVMGCSGVAALSAGNLEAVAKEVKKLAPDAEIVIVADDDQKPDTERNPGRDAAINAAAAIGCKWVTPDLGKKADAWDVWSEQGPDGTRAMIAEAREVKSTAEHRNLTQLARNEQWELTTPEWPSMDAKAYRGLAADFTNLATKNSEADPAAILATFLVRFGVECGPDIYMNVGDTKHRARMAAVVTGASSKARKGTSGKPVLKLFDFSNMTYSNDEPFRTARTSKGPFSSGEGIIYAIRDSVKKWDSKEQTEKIVDPGVEDKRLFVLDEEFGGVLANTKREGNTLSMIIRQAWDSGNFDPLTKNNKTTATGGHVGWISHITLQELHAKLGESEGFNGFANRILWICAKRGKLVALPQPMPEQKLEEIQGRLIGILGKISGGVEIKLGAAAKVAWCDRHYADLTKDRPGLVGSVTNRGEAQALRLAMIYCLLDGDTTITIDHLEAGIAFWDYCRQSANYIFHGRQTDNTAQTVLEALQKGSMTGTDIFKLFKNNVTKERLDTAMTELIASNQVIIEKQKNPRGAPTKLYHLVEKPYELKESNELNATESEEEPNKFVNSFNSLSDGVNNHLVIDI